jgi:hypothetical protein
LEVDVLLAAAVVAFCEAMAMGEAAAATQSMLVLRTSEPTTFSPAVEPQRAEC